MDPTEGQMTETSSPELISTKQRRIAELARQYPQTAFTTLSHHIDLAWLTEAYRRTRKDGAVGVDGQTAAQYEEHLEENLQSLLDRAKSGRYRAPAVRRVHIPKGDGTTRPLGIPSFEDKVLQRAVAMVLEPLYEQDFLDCSYGFRPGRSAHGALEAVQQRLWSMGGGFVLDVDLRKFFDTLDHGVLRELLGRRVRDGVLVRLIGKWLHAGVWEDGAVTHPETGTPQGGVISPLLANVYLHDVLDVWFENEAKPRLKGAAFLVRYADDLVIGFAEETDARRVWKVLPQRLEKYGLRLHPDKTRLLDFRRPGSSGDGGGPGSFDFLGFTHHWAKSRNGAWVLKRQTSKSRMSRALHRVRDWCARHRHLPLREQQQALASKLRGHCAYYGITGNARALVRYRQGVLTLWKKWLDRRSQRARLPWDTFKRLLERYPLPPAYAVHSRYRRVANP